MSKKIWNVKFVAGNPDIFSGVKMAAFILVHLFIAVAMVRQESEQAK